MPISKTSCCEMGEDWVIFHVCFKYWQRLWFLYVQLDWRRNFGELMANVNVHILDQLVASQKRCVCVSYSCLYQYLEDSESVEVGYVLSVPHPPTKKWTIDLFALSLLLKTPPSTWPDQILLFLLGMQVKSLVNNLRLSNYHIDNSLIHHLEY